ncbi:hypothetical protein AVO45_01790 [Ruegeria marisrubri]|uniref:Glycosyltransferase n=1 Tax=Ruegeria marisrubri TaxID=1685379 RepID=A0A117KGZ3_9RHOB|nr:hypothetical protein [Ruegeria marisrubri]KUJ85740.1 hypothetical protein AVO45_01790 [Ruegeria marisrubri]
MVILLKNAAASLTPRALEILRARVRGLCIDHLDVPASNETFGLVDVHIAASFRGKEILEKTLAGHSDLPAGIEIKHLAHHADPRLSPLARGAERFSIGYFGKPSNTVLASSLATRILSPDYGRDENFASVVEGMQRCPMHYCVRAPAGRPAVAERLAKPFTKGFNAAAVGANVLVNRQVDDAVAYLGEDYPFLIDDLSEASINEAIEKARELFGGPEWARGLDTMREVRARTAPAEIARQLGDILALFD